ncbi:hypothetical protein N7457_005315 [Penicillium paradoxum]|uniref:uncharacterized protein n=1 Tax=Penicillium paradoxum TaxID=176176 RepID=UPI002548C3E1|nr:uncharacterized protein N7457_005315 [Penicillium paradoxum]KAJ5780155.1 hypothetical protein N7457_005315 [Penicillium paradoxum]
MAITCTASSRLALPAVLRNVFHSQSASNFGASSIIPYRRPVASGLCPSNLPLQRSFTSISRFGDSQNEQSEHASSVAPAGVDAPVPQQKTVRKKHHDSKGNKTGWNTHKGQFKGQRRGSEIRTGRTDRERRAFRNETRREAEKQPRRAWQDMAERAKQDLEKRGNKKPEHWQVQKAALKEKFAEGWNPTKKLSPDALDGIRTLHAKAPEKFTTAVLAEEFEVSPEAIRRILKSKWRPSEDEMESRRKRWENRHDRIWSRMAELGLRPSTNRTRPVSDFHVLYDDNNRERR